MKREECPHVAAAPDPAPRADRCEDCGSHHSLRMCTTCGYVGCCESQAGHDQLHWKGTGHPIIRSLPLAGRSFIWCYACNDYLY